MKKLVFALSLVPALAFADLKVATVDIMLLVRNHPDYERNEKLLETTDKDYEKKVESIKAEGEKFQAEGKKLMEQYRNPMLNEKAKGELEKQISELQQKLIAIEQRYRSESMRCHQDLQELRQRLLKTTTDDLRARVKKFAEEKGYDAVFDSNVMPYAKGSLDVTELVLKEMGVDPSKAKGKNEGK